MTDELTKTFFDTFEIKQREYTQCCSLGCKKPYTDCVNCQYHEVYKIDYPEITDHILLELIRLGLNYDFVIHSKSKDELKEKLLALLIRNDVEFKQQVQALFEEK